MGGTGNRSGDIGSENCVFESACVCVCVCVCIFERKEALVSLVIIGYRTPR